MKVLLCTSRHLQQYPSHPQIQHAADGSWGDEGPAAWAGPAGPGEGQQDI